MIVQIWAILVEKQVMLRKTSNKCAFRLKQQKSLIKPVMLPLLGGGFRENHSGRVRKRKGDGDGRK